MPNHVKNVLTFKNLKPDEIEFIVNTIASPLDHPEDDYSNYAIDFNKIIPEPRFEEECPDEYKVNKDSGVSPLEDKPWFDWCKWRLTHWETKWNAYDCYSMKGKDCITFVFSTAWSMAHPVIEQLHLLGFQFELAYADEDWGSNCGTLSYDGKADITWQTATDLKDPGEFARNLWDEY